MGLWGGIKGTYGGVRCTLGVLGKDPTRVAGRRASEEVVLTAGKWLRQRSSGRGGVWSAAVEGGRDARGPREIVGCESFAPKARCSLSTFNFL